MTRTCEHPGCTTRLRSTRPPEDVYCSAHETALVEVPEQPIGYEARRERIVDLINERGQRSISEIARRIGAGEGQTAKDVHALIAQGRLELVRKGDQRAPSVYRVVPSADELDELMGNCAA